MLYYFAALLAAALILIISNPKSEINRWAAIFLSFASIGGLSEEVGGAGYEGWANAIQFLNLTATPYAVLIFCIVYSGMPDKGNRFAHAWLKWALLLPIGLTAAMTPFEPAMKIDYGWLLVWAGPYYVAGCALLVASLARESNRSKRRNRLVTTLIVVPTLLAALAFIYVAGAVYPEFEFFGYVSYFLIYSFLLALLCVFVYGVLGVRLRIERDPFDDTMKAVSTGTRLLNHTLKNEIGKIAISAENLKRTTPPEDELSGQHLRIISESSDHMLAMVERIHNRTKDIVLAPKLSRLDRLAEQCVDSCRPLFVEKEIAIEMSLEANPTLLCDPVHVKEAIGNLLSNAAEATQPGGNVRVTVRESAKGASLTVEDTGKGIAAEALARVFEPFYSTKNNSRNFGLGLSYVYNVMRKSGGSVDVSSRVDEGTRITLHFPKG